MARKPTDKGILGSAMDRAKEKIKNSPIAKIARGEGGKMVSDHMKKSPIGKAMAHKGGIKGAIGDHLKQAPIGQIAKNGLSATITDARAKRAAKAAKAKKGVL